MLLFSKWITYTTGDHKGMDDKYGNPSPYFRKSFELKDNVKKATLQISALGVFNVYINGEPVSNDYLSPGWTDYLKHLPMVTYDITNKVQKKNGIGVVLGDGWALGHLGSTTTFKRTGYSDRIEFSATITVEYEDGTKEEIITDETWRATQGAIRRSDIHMGEYIDTRLSVGNFSDPDYDDASWDYAWAPEFKFTRNPYVWPVINPPTVVKHTFVPKLLERNGNTYLYDVTQNITGVLKCVFNGTRGTKIVFRHGELLDKGKLYTENLRKAEATDTFILSGTGDEVFRPLFTFHGFRYAEITVYGQAEIKDIIAEVMYTDLKETGTFTCDNPIVDKVYQNALWGQRGNFLNVPTDCPQRDERLGWTADTQIFCKSAMYNMDCKIFYKKYLRDVCDAQLGNGVIPIVAPMPHVGFLNYVGHDAAAGWADAIAEIPYFYYMMYGDKRIIRDTLLPLKRLIDFYEVESPEFVRDRCWGYGDWLSINATTDMGVISTLYYARTVYDCAELCHVVGDYEEQHYRDLYENIKKAFRARYMDENGKIFSDTQTCYIVAYKFGIISAEEARTHMTRKLKEDGGHLTSGFLGIKFLLPTLCEVGMKDEAYRIMSSTDFPGWGYSVVQGATTIWERWDGYTEENGIMGGMNSFNHYSFGSCTEWMYEYCLGINPHFENPGFREVTFRPYLDTTGKITSASGHYDTDFGTISVDWKLEDGVYTYNVTIPEGIEYHFDFVDMTMIRAKTNDNTYTFHLKAK